MRLTDANPNSAHPGESRDPVVRQRRVPAFARMSGGGLIAYAAMLLWFLLTVLAPLRANAAQEDARPVLLRASDMLPRIEEVLMKEGVGAGAEIALADPEATFPALAGQLPEFNSVSVNPASGRFVVRLRGIDGSPGLAIAGVARVAARLPALMAPLMRGDIITESDIDWIETMEARPADFIASADELVGMEARRALRAGEPLRANDVVAPILVKKGALVTMTYSVSGLNLTHAGIAQATGAKGDVISVKNIRSERIVKAFVAGENLVAVVSSRFAASEFAPSDLE